MTEILIALLIVLVVVTAVGHGLWLLVAWLLRGCRSRKRRAYYEPTTEDDRAATIRFMEYLRRRNAIEDEVRIRVLRAVGDEVTPHTEAWQPGSRAQAYMASRAAVQEENTPGLEVLPPHDGAESADAAPFVESPTPQDVDSPAESDAALPVQPVPPAVFSPQPAAANVEREAFSPAAAHDTATRDTAAHDTPSVWPAPSPPRRPFSEILLAFMAERNIRWGEIIGGLLIVCCSAALVISLWSRIEAIPVLKFIIFTAVTAGLFGAGFFVFHRWNVPTTGRAVLQIATLLVPLNLLAFAAFSLHGPLSSSWSTPIEWAAVFLFGWLALRAARILIPSNPWLYMLGVVGVSAFSLVVRLALPLSGWILWGAALLPVLVSLAIVTLSVRRLAPHLRVGNDDARRLYLQLGAQIYACLAPVGLVAFETKFAWTAMQVLAPVLAALVAPAAVVGFLVWHRLVRAGEPMLRISGASVAVLAWFLLAAAPVVAFPAPIRLVPALIVLGAAMAMTGRYTARLAIHAAAVAAFAAATVFTVHAVIGLSWSADSTAAVLKSLLAARTGQSLVIVVAFCGLLAAWFAQRRRRALSINYAVITLATMVVSIAFVTAFGFARQGDPAHVTWVYAVYAAAALVLAARVNSSLGVWCGAFLAQMALVQMFVYIWPVGRMAWPTVLLIGASACAIGFVVLRLRPPTGKLVRLYLRPMAWMTTVFSVSATIAGGILLSHQPTLPCTLHLTWLAAIWLALAFAVGSAPLLAAGQLAMAVAACAAVRSSFHDADWYHRLATTTAEPWVLQGYALAVVGVVLVWALLRFAVIRLAQAGRPAGDGHDRRAWVLPLQRLFDSPVPLADQWLRLCVLFASIVLSIAAVSPGVAAAHAWLPQADTDILFSHARGLGSWLLVAVLTLVYLLSLNQRKTWRPSVGLLLAVACAVMLAASRFDGTGDVLTALRWLCAAVFLAGSFAVWTKSRWQRRLGGAVQAVASDPGAARIIFPVFCNLFALPAILFTITLALTEAIRYQMLPPGMPVNEYRLLLLGPSALVIAALLGYARTTRRQVYGVAAAVVASAVVTATEWGALPLRNASASLEFGAVLLQLNAALVAVLTFITRVLVGWERQPAMGDVGMRLPLLVLRVPVALGMLFAVIDLWGNPGRASAFLAAWGTLGGLAAVILLEIALIVTEHHDHDEPRESVIAAPVFFAMVLVTAAVAPWDTGNWLCFHTLMVAVPIGGAVILAVAARQRIRHFGSQWSEALQAALAQADRRSDTIEHDLACSSCGYNLRRLPFLGACPECNAAIAASLSAAENRLGAQRTGWLVALQSHTTAFVLICAGLAALLCVPAASGDPLRPWMAFGVLIASALLCFTASVWSLRRALGYAGALLVLAAASLAFMTSPAGGWRSWSADMAFNLLNIDVLAIVAVASSALAMELRVFRKSLLQRSSWPRLDRLATFIAAGSLTVIAAAHLASAVELHAWSGSAVLQWGAWLAVFALLCAHRVGGSAWMIAPGLYLMGVVAIALALSMPGWSRETLCWVAAVMLAGFVMTTTLVWRFSPSARILVRLAGGNWLWNANVFLAEAPLVLAPVASLMAEALLGRATVVIVPILCAVAVWYSSRRSPGHGIRTAVLALLALSVFMMWGVWTAPGTELFFLHRAIGVAGAAALTFALLGGLTALDRRRDWSLAIRCTAGAALALGAIALPIALAYEVNALSRGESLPLATWATATLFAVPLITLISCVLFAVRDQWDPLGVPERFRGAYVHAAELLAAALALHLRAAMPWLFSGVVVRYWPMLVIGLGFVAVAAGELLSRRRLEVLARPLSHTGTFLPILCLLELFLKVSPVHFSVVLLTIGTLYAIVASLRRSTVLALGAAAAFTGSLWYLLGHSPGLEMTRHPQLWFIPPALAVLLAGHLNRARVTPQQSAGLHYGCLLVVYFSSTADIFLVGVARAPWLPLVLTGLSLLGVLVGVALRIRSFLLLGAGFLCLSLLTMIWHAAANLGWTWLWYVAGIVLGVGIITLFALFEKKRNDVDALLEKLRSWSA